MSSPEKTSWLLDGKEKQKKLANGGRHPPPPRAQATCQGLTQDSPVSIKVDCLFQKRQIVKIVINE